jgi:RluA family pseudouridine synthase
MAFPLEIEVIYRDPALLLINKPAGLLTLPDGYNPALPHAKSLLEGQAGRLWIVHRLDKETSGVLLLARSAETHRSLNAQFEQHQVAKIYHALVKGFPDWEEKSISLPLRSNGDRSHRTVVDFDRGKPATTHLIVLERFIGYCLLEAAPETGRTHQIRAHLSTEGLSILGDKLYPESKRAVPMEHTGQPGYIIELSRIPIVGIGLHARSLEITHPVSGQRLKFEAAYPAWWEHALRLLRNKDLAV